MNLKSGNIKKLLPNEADKQVVLSQARDAPELMKFIDELLWDRLAQQEDVSADDSNWVVKRAMKDGRQAELKLLQNILCGE